MKVIFAFLLFYFSQAASLNVTVPSENDEVHCIFQHIKRRGSIDLQGHDLEYVPAQPIDCDAIFANERIEMEKRTQKQFEDRNIPQAARACIIQMFEKINAFDLFLTGRIFRGVKMTPSLTDEESLKIFQFSLKKDAELDAIANDCIIQNAPLALITN